MPTSSCGNELASEIRSPGEPTPRKSGDALASAVRNDLNDTLPSSLVLGFPHSLTAPAQAKGKTLFLHFSGPTGVGKSLAGRLVAEALFQG
jgi:hypothetical protein